MNAAKRTKALMENYLEARKEGPTAGFDIRQVDPDNLEHYYILIKPTSGVYKGQKYIMELKTAYGHGADTAYYPTKPPYAHFITTIHHVNISPNGGSICLDILKDITKWSPLNSFSTVVQNILLLFNEPNNASPYNGDASKLWVECEKYYKSTKAPKASVADDDKHYLECFKPFIEKAEAVMKQTDITTYSKWFPELEEPSDDRDLRIAKENSEFEELYKNYQESKNKAKESTAKEVSKEDEKKKNRWAKYQKS